MRFRAKNSAIWEYVSLLRANRIARIAGSDFKVNVMSVDMASFLFFCFVDP